MQCSSQLIIFLLFHRAYGGDQNGSAYLQAFALFLREEYMRHPLDRIYLMVKQAMIIAEQVRFPFSTYLLLSQERKS